MIGIFETFFREIGLSFELAYLTGRFAVVLVLVAVSIAANLLGRLLLSSVVGRIVRHTKTRWDDIVYDRGVLSRLSHIVPALLFYFTAYLVFPENEVVPLLVRRLSVAYIILVSVFSLSALLDAANDIYVISSPQARERPIKGYVQLVKIVVVLIGIILVITTLMNVSPVGILSGLGAMSAVVLLVFRDAILGFVSSLHLTGNNMVEIGDWIEMPKYGADGEVIDITLQSIRVQNWDKTISSLPIYALVSDSFKNWRGMQQSGGRRIKRAINIDMRSVRFCTTEMLDRFQRFHLIADYVNARRTEVEEHNRTRGLDADDIVSGRALTNLGTFRAYVSAYLRSHPHIHQDLTFLVRHLDPGPTGIPLEIYVFSAKQEWAQYESIQADIFDHLLAVLPEFDLRVYQEPSGWDLQAVADALRTSAGL
jgi:miniconductance mechanosensitive channel